VIKGLIIACIIYGIDEHYTSCCLANNTILKDLDLFYLFLFWVLVFYFCYIQFLHLLIKVCRGLPLQFLSKKQNQLNFNKFQINL
jgi:hypothetical protein